jgi:hypothetical protein
MRRNNQIIVEALINKMFEISGHSVTFTDVKDRKDDWYQEYTMTEQQCYEWLEWGTEYLRKALKINKRMAEREMSSVNLNWGLKISQEEQHV